MVFFQFFHFCQFCQFFFTLIIMASAWKIDSMDP